MPPQDLRRIEDNPPRSPRKGIDSLPRKALECKAPEAIDSNGFVRMLNFIKVRRARSIVEQVGVDIVDSLSALSPADRAATMAIANAMLLAASKRWGKAVLDAPETIETKSAMTMVFELAAMHQNVVSGYLEPMRHRGMQDVTFAQGVREARAAEIVVATVGMALIPESRQRVVQAWKVLWNARTEAEDGIALLLQFASHSKTSPFPAIGIRMDKPKAMQFATSIPPFLRPKTPSARPGGAPSQPKATAAR